MRLFTRSLALLPTALVAAACNRSASNVALSPISTVSAATIVGTAPMFAVSPAGDRAIAWVSAPGGGTDGRLYVAVDSAKPTELRDSLGPVEAHGEAPPKLAYAPNGTLYAIYTVGRLMPGKRFPESALRLVQSSDRGRTWTAPVTVTDEAIFGSHSFHALHVAANGTVYVSWLGKPDAPAALMAMGRAGASMEASHADHMEHEASAAWIARSTDGGRTWQPRVRVDQGESCPCCRTSVVSARDGTLYMAWRHVFQGNIRDIVVARSTDQGATWSSPIRVHADDWHFDGCPHAGPAIALDSGDVLHVAWWTGKEGAAGVYYAQSADGARTFGPAVPLGVAKFSRPAHVQLALAPRNRVIVVWDDGTTQVPQVVMRVSDDGGAHFGDETVLSAPGRAATFPALGAAGDSVSIAWSEDSAAAAERASAAMAQSKMTKAPQGLDRVGDAQVMMREAVLQ